MNRLRLGFAIAGLVLALLSVVLDSRILGWCAIVFLAASIILRLILRKQRNPKSDRGNSV
jgi:hypothetical protein